MASTSGGGQHGSTTSTALSSNACFTFHLVSFLIYLYIFCWHFSEQASTMPQAWEFGWYFEFLTFYAFAFQMVALMTSFISHLMPEVRMLKRIANDMSCAGFEIANATTLVYWTGGRCSFMVIISNQFWECWRRLGRPPHNREDFQVYVCEARNEDFPHPFAKPLRQPDGSIIVSS